MRLEILKGKQIIDSDFAERIIEFDKLNMKAVLEDAGIEFPEEKRRAGFKSDPTFIVAFEKEEIAGYLEFLRSWRDPNYIYIASVQIAEKHRRTGSLLNLLDNFRFLVSGEDFIGFETNVQKTNRLAVKLYRKIGFKLRETPNNAASWLAQADRDLLETSPILPLLYKWRDKN